MRRLFAAAMSLTLAAMSTVGMATAAEYRIEATGGWNTATFGYTDDFRVGDGRFNIDISNESLGDGPAWGAGIWVDNWIGRNWSLGFQYIGLKLETNTTGIVGTVGNTPITLGFGTDLTMHSFATNIAWRKFEGRWHPYIGAGLFVGFIDGRVTGLAAVPGAAGVASARFTQPLAGIQGFAGVDFELTKHIYVGISGRTMYIDARPVGVDLHTVDFLGFAHIGYKF